MKYDNKLLSHDMYLSRIFSDANITTQMNLFVFVFHDIINFLRNQLKVICFKIFHYLDVFHILF